MTVLSLTSSIDVLALNALAASVVLGVIGLLLATLARRTSLPLQHGLLCVVLLLSVTSPLLSWTASAQGYGLVPIDIGSATRGSRQSVTPSATATQTELAVKLRPNDASPIASAADSSKTTASKPSSTVVRGPDQHTRSLTVLFSRDVGMWLAMIWGIGAAWRMIQLARGLIVIRRLQQSLRPASNPRLINAATTALAASIQQKTPIYESVSAPAPLTFGWCKHGIVVPDGLVD